MSYCLYCEMPKEICDCPNIEFGNPDLIKKLKKIKKKKPKPNH